MANILGPQPEHTQTEQGCQKEEDIDQIFTCVVDWFDSFIWCDISPSYVWCTKRLLPKWTLKFRCIWSLRENIEKKLYTRFKTLDEFCAKWMEYVVNTT